MQRKTQNRVSDCSSWELWRLVHGEFSSARNSFGGTQAPSLSICSLPGSLVGREQEEKHAQPHICSLQCRAEVGQERHVPASAGSCGEQLCRSMTLPRTTAAVHRLFLLASALCIKGDVEEGSGAGSRSWKEEPTCHKCCL